MLVRFFSFFFLVYALLGVRQFVIWGELVPCLGALCLVAAHALVTFETPEEHETLFMGGLFTLLALVGGTAMVFSRHLHMFMLPALASFTFGVLYVLFKVLSLLGRWRDRQIWVKGK